MSKLTHSLIIISSNLVERRLIVMADYDPFTGDVEIESVVVQEQAFAENDVQKYADKIDSVDLTEMLRWLPGLENELYKIDWQANHREKQLTREYA